jgi:hypothetical protein
MRAFRSVAGATFALLLLAALGACWSKTVGPDRSIKLVVRNRTFATMNIYALPSPGGISSRARVTTINGFTEDTVAVPNRMLQASGSLVLYLHAIGGRSQVMPSISISTDEIGYLEIYADATGDLSRSVIYKGLGPGDGAAAATGSPLQAPDKAAPLAR